MASQSNAGFDYCPKSSKNGNKRRKTHHEEETTKEKTLTFLGAANWDFGLLLESSPQETSHLRILTQSTAFKE